MGKKKDPKQLGKVIAYVLGLRPDEFGLVPDEHGFVSLKDLLKAVSEEPGWGYVRKSDINEVLLTCRENYFVLDNDRIKSTQCDHTAKRAANVSPPKILYHCVRRKAHPVVCQKGIIPMGRSHVFLTTSEELAMRMGRRRDPTPVLLTVQAERAFKAGVRFSRFGELIYIVDRVPIDYFSGPPLPKEKKEAPKGEKEPLLTSESMPGSFALDLERSKTLQHQQLKKKGLKKEIAWKKDARKFRRKRER